LNKWMKTFLPKECVVHGMRHAFRDRLRAVNAPTDMIDQLGGWSHTDIGQNYGNGYNIVDSHWWIVRLQAEHLGI